MKIHANSRISYRDRVGQKPQRKKRKDQMKSRKSSTVSHLKQYRYIKSVVVSS